MTRTARLVRGLVFVMLAVAAMPRAASAWTDAGHRLIALVAWERLDEPTREAIVQLLRSHDRFGEDFKGRMPRDLRQAHAATRNRWIFQQAAVWPDLAGDFTGGSRTRHYQPTWHAISQPLFLTAADEHSLWKAGLPVNIGTQWFPSMRAGEMNIVQALQQTRARLRNPSAPAAEKALALTWLIHLVGDLHQPTRATALFSERRFPNGDRGGSEIATTAGGNLHAYWDGILDSFAEMDLQVTCWLADPALVQRGEAAAESLDEGRWMTESAALARTVAYDTMLIHSLVDAERDVTRYVEPFAIDERYDERARSAAAQRAVEAGFRLAAVLDGLFD